MYVTNAFGIFTVIALDFEIVLALCFLLQNTQDPELLKRKG